MTKPYVPMHLLPIGLTLAMSEMLRKVKKNLLQWVPLKGITDNGFNPLLEWNSSHLTNTNYHFQPNVWQVNLLISISQLYKSVCLCPRVIPISSILQGWPDFFSRGPFSIILNVLGPGKNSGGQGSNFVLKLIC